MPDQGYQLCFGKRFAKQSVGFEIFGIFRITGNNHDGDVPKECLEVFEKRNAIQARHSNIRQDEVNFPVIEEANCLQPFGGLGYVAAGFPQCASYLSSLYRIVFDNEYSSSQHDYRSFLACRRQRRYGIISLAVSFRKAFGWLK